MTSKDLTALTIKLKEEGKFDQLCDVLAQAHRKAPSDCAILMMNIFTCRQLDRYREAVEFGEKMEKLVEIDGLTKHELGICYASVKDYEKAIEYLTDSVTELGGFVSIDGQQALTWSYLQHGMGEMALEGAKELLRILEDPYHRYLLAATYQKLGKLSKAFSIYYGIVSSNPEEVPPLARMLEIVMTKREVLQNPLLLIRVIKENLKKVVNNNQLRFTIMCFMSCISMVCDLDILYSRFMENIETEQNLIGQICFVVSGFLYQDPGFVKKKLIEILQIEHSLCHDGELLSLIELLSSE
jgi:tetratricopeptide (TPR) repeat protein